MYFITMFHKQWYVPPNYYLPRDFYEKMNMMSSADAEYSMLVSFCKSRNIRVYTRNSSGSIRVCHTCKLLKPDRTHHCSTCEACVVKMDHHCPWVNNCIGFTNYKYFLMVVLYAGILCTYYFATTLEYSIDFFMDIGEHPHLRRVNIVIW
ncbi:palmitoyltransferase ZDHHC15-like [Atheta coriaria]|uniref:palmitoyltransferase ZDHHC15-like n=1 Tax=Dalotia coriaria TaxID=877792 RepID=UPI0031F36A8E